MPLLFFIIIVPFIFLVLFDSMIVYHVSDKVGLKTFESHSSQQTPILMKMLLILQAYLAADLLFSAFIKMDRARLPEWEEMVAVFHLAPKRSVGTERSREIIDAFIVGHRCTLMYCTFHGILSSTSGGGPSAHLFGDDGEGGSFEADVA